MADFHEHVICRSCVSVTRCRQFTIRESVDLEHSYLVIDGQCDDCLESYGPDDHCSDPPEQQDEAEARAERAYRELDRGEL